MKCEAKSERKSQSPPPGMQEFETASAADDNELYSFDNAAVEMKSAAVIFTLLLHS